MTIIQPKSSFTLKAVYQFLIGFCLFVFASSVLAYTFPGNLPPGCSGSSGNYTCGALNLSQSVTFTDSGNVNITVNGDLKTNGINIGSASQAANVTFNISGWGPKAEILSSGTIYANLNITPTSSTGNVYIMMNGSSVINGNITGAGQNSVYFYMYNNTIVNGDVDLYGLNRSIAELRSNATVNGDLYSRSDTNDNGDVTLYDAGSTINGDVQAYGDIQTVGVITGCAQITNDTYSYAQMFLFYGSSTNAICKGERGACQASSGYVANNSNPSTPPDCAAVPAELIAEYHLDEQSWDGTANESKDTAGFTGGPFDGQGIGTIKPTAGSNNPTPPDTCGYATFTGDALASAFTLDDLPISTTAGAKTTVSFWMYWDGNANYSTPIGWNLYALAIGDNVFGFDTFNGDRYGVNISALTPGWRHIVAVFNNGDVTQSQLYIDGVKQTLSQVRGVPNNSHAYVQPTLNLAKITANWNTNGFPQGRIDEVKVYNGAVTQAQVDADMAATHNCSPAELIAEYHFDETVWDGTPNETKDTANHASGPFHTESVGVNKTNPSNDDPARSINAGEAGTCGYVQFGYGFPSGFLLDNLPVSTATGSKTSVSFWMHWNGDSYVYPMGWHNLRLWMLHNHFGFSTGSSGDIYGTSATGLENSWHHVVAVFTNGDLASSTLYIDGVKKTLSQNYGTSDNALAYVQSTLKVSGHTVNNVHSFNDGRIDEVKVYNGEVTQGQVTADYNATHACPGSVINVDASDFNCIAEQETDPAAGHLYMQMVNQPFNIKVVALKSDGTAETSFAAASDRDVALAFINQNNANSPVTFNDGTNKTSKTITFTTSNTTGMVAVNALSIPAAYQNLTCQITDTGETPTKIVNASDAFSVRPSQLTVTSSNANADDAGTNVSATPIIKAGSNFTLNADSATASYTGQPAIDSSKIVTHSGAVQAGNLTGAFNTNAVNGVATGSTFAYSEVGYFKLTTGGIYDASWTNVDQAADCTNDFSNTAVNGKFGCKFANTSDTVYFGRFIPDHYDISATATSPACTSTGTDFTYYGQDGLATSFLISAKNSSDDVTQNYTGTLAKLALTNWNNFVFSANPLPTGAILSAGATAPAGTWLNGLASVSTKHVISRTSSPSDPASLTISAKPTDSDGVTTTAATAVSTSSPFKYGRLHLSNAYGSELKPLSVPIATQYWDGTSYRANTDDGCSTISAADISLSNYLKNLNAGETSASGGGLIVNAMSAIQLSSPGAGNGGSVDLTYNLNNLPWFGTIAPVAKATFGLNQTPILYIRENY